MTPEEKLKEAFRLLTEFADEGRPNAKADALFRIANDDESCILYFAEGSTIAALESAFHEQVEARESIIYSKGKVN